MHVGVLVPQRQHKQLGQSPGSNTAPENNKRQLLPAIQTTQSNPSLASTGIIPPNNQLFISLLNLFSAL